MADILHYDELARLTRTNDDLRKLFPTFGRHLNEQLIFGLERCENSLFSSICLPCQYIHQGFPLDRSSMIDAWFYSLSLSFRFSLLSVNIVSWCLLMKNGPNQKSRFSFFFSSIVWHMIDASIQKRKKKHWKSLFGFIFFMSLIIQCQIFDNSVHFFVSFFLCPVSSFCCHQFLRLVPVHDLSFSLVI